MNECRNPNCTQRPRITGLCVACYHYLRRTGEDRPTRLCDSLAHDGGDAQQDLIDIVERFLAQVHIDPDSDCWIWTGASTTRGYGRMTIDGTTTSTHRFAYQMLVGPIPPGNVIDHLCERQRCCNPDHLEPVTQAENIRRYHRNHPGKSDWSLPA